MEFIELEKIYRQKSENFISLLNAVRNNSAGNKELALLNERVGVEFKKVSQSERCISLVTTNKAAYAINTGHINALAGRDYIYDSDIEGDFSKQSYPADEKLYIKNPLLQNMKEGEDRCCKKFDPKKWDKKKVTWKGKLFVKG